MNQQLNDYSQAVSQYIENLPKDGGDWLVAQRSSAAERFTEIGFPNAKIEAWKYTGIEGLLKQGFETTDKLPEFPEHAVLRQFLEEPVAGRLVFVDGVYQADLSTCDTAGITVGNLRSAMAASDRAVLEVIGSLSGMGDHGFAALNLATVHDGAVIRVTSETCLEQPIELLHVATKSAEGQALRSRHLIMLETGASANLIERYVALDDAAY
ncbi:MAG: hypothetical protein KZQ73_15395, partial [Candidatus Thiodiazotropha sp. (ex Semelilucina semeliformis)]|nr:hypothetical protein [Candidatus Thiodiazotropha sp. (ex Semelilucina semeliformis)]